MLDSSVFFVDFFFLQLYVLFLPPDYEHENNVYLSNGIYLFEPFVFAALNTKDLDVFIKRNQESGFGFRVLGGEGPDQPVRSRAQLLETSDMLLLL